LGKTLIIAAFVVAVALVLTVMIVVGKRLIEGPGVKRRELKEAQDEVGRQRRAIAAIERETAKWGDLESVLAGAIKAELEKLRDDNEKGRY